MNDRGMTKTFLFIKICLMFNKIIMMFLCFVFSYRTWFMYHINPDPFMKAMMKKGYEGLLKQQNDKELRLKELEDEFARKSIVVDNHFVPAVCECLLHC